MYLDKQPPDLCCIEIPKYAPMTLISSGRLNGHQKDGFQISHQSVFPF